VISALLSREREYALHPLTTEQIVTLIERALANERKGLGGRGLAAAGDVLERIAVYSDGDARTACNVLEIAATAAVDGRITNALLEDVLQRKTLLFDKSGEEHFYLISALHKSVRSSDVQAALYWLGRMIEAGEDRLYIARRLVRMAIEDIGMADPRALEQAIAVKECVHFLGIPEGDQALAQAAIYLAAAPKSDAAYRALNEVRDTIQSGIAHAVPMRLRNAPTRHMKDWGYGKGYQHAHEFQDAVTDMQCLPDELAGRRFYAPTDRGFEARLQQRLEDLERIRSRTEEE
jgi:putative ATPase